MQKYRTDQIRNIVLLSHGGAGKTSLAEAMLFDSGAINRLGKVDEGTSTSDWDPDEQKRTISINTSLIPVAWQNSKINVLDAPGYADFIGEMKSAVAVADTAVILICAASGVEVGTEMVWRYAVEAGLPKMVMFNRIDRDNADFQRVLEQAQAQLSSHCVAVQIPVGAQANFQGVIDLINQKAYLGQEGKEEAIPADLSDEVADYREKLIEAIAETNDDLLTKYLEGEALSDEELHSALREAVAQGSIIPVAVGSATQNVGVRAFMDSVIALLPGPEGRPAVMASAGEDGKELELASDPTGALAAFIFKSTADPYVGKLSFFRVFNGTLKSDSQVWNANKGKLERVGQLLMVRGKNQEPVQEVTAGDLGAVAKLTDTTTNDTLCIKEQPIMLPPTSFPMPLFRVAVHAKTKADLDKLSNSLSRLVEEDLTLQVYKDPDTAETIMAGIGESHVDVAIEKMKRKFGADVAAGLPRVSYKETITLSAKAEYKHKKQTGGHGQYGHVLIELQPLPRGSGVEFTDRVVGGSVPKNYIPAVAKGVQSTVHEGVLAQFPMVDIRVTLYDGSYHPVDSSDMAFQIAGSQALKLGVEKAQPTLLEPVMSLQVRVPDSIMGDAISDLNTKRAKVSGMTPVDGTTVIEALAPLSELQRFATDLRSISQGRGSFTMEFSHYEEVPGHLTAKVIEQTKKDREAAEKNA